MLEVLGALILLSLLASEAERKTAAAQSRALTDALLREGDPIYRFVLVIEKPGEQSDLETLMDDFADNEAILHSSDPVVSAYALEVDQEMSEWLPRFYNEKNRVVDHGFLREAWVHPVKIHRQKKVRTVGYFVFLLDMKVPGQLTGQRDAILRWATQWIEQFPKSEWWDDPWVYVLDTLGPGVTQQSYELSEQETAFLGNAEALGFPIPMDLPLETMGLALMKDVYVQVLEGKEPTIHWPDQPQHTGR